MIASKKNVVIYHKGCSDGFGAAWAAWKKFGNSADYFGEEHNMPPPKNLKGKDVYIVDFGYSAVVTKRILKEASSLTIIDHHISAKDVIQTATSYSYDINHSGAVLTWLYFHPKKPIPRILRHIEDVDLWKFKLKGTRELMSSLELYGFDFKVWDKLAKEFASQRGIKKHLGAGEIIGRYEKRIIDKAIYRSNIVRFEGYKVMAANSNVLASEIGNAMVKIVPPIAIIFCQVHGKKIVSLRSNGKVDVSKLAAKYGGGGHKAAAGFQLKLSESYPWQILKPSN